MVLLVCPTYCFLHCLQVMQYIRLELLQVILVLLSCSANVTLHFILPLVFKIGQYLHCFFALHLFLIWFAVYITVSDVLFVTVISLSWVVFVTEVLPCKASLFVGLLFRKSSIELCFFGVNFVLILGKVSSLALLLGC